MLGDGRSGGTANPHRWPPQSLALGNREHPQAKHAIIWTVWNGRYTALSWHCSGSRHLAGSRVRHCIANAMRRSRSALDAVPSGLRAGEGSPPPPGQGRPLSKASAYPFARLHRIGATSVLTAATPDAAGGEVAFEQRPAHPCGAPAGRSGVRPIPDTVIEMSARNTPFTPANTQLPLAMPSRRFPKPWSIEPMPSGYRA